MTMTFGALAGAASTRAVTGVRVLGAVLLIILALIVGTAHVVASPSAEVWFRAAKVGSFMVAIACGAAFALASRSTSTS
jgi:hypothetical protein